MLATASVFVIGENRRVWDRKVTYHATWQDVSGLKAGSAIRMGGIDVGSVSDVKHSDDPKDSSVYVTLAVARNEAGRVRKDSTVTIAGKGLLGDKMIELTVGSPDQEAIPEGGTIKSVPSSDLGQIVSDAQDVARQAKLALQNVQKITEQIADPQFTSDLRGTVKSLHDILDGVAHKDGVAHRMIFDPEEARRVDHILANLDSATANMNAISSDAREITSRAKSGPGLVHTLVYDDQLAQGTAGTMVELNKSLQALRTGNGLGHAIVYGDDSTQHVMGNVSAMSDDMREIVANVKAGRGTIGALLVDPSVYEDIKSIVGNVERNQVLRALVRYSIKQNEDQKPHAEVKDAKPQPQGSNR
ncbi:Mce family protein [Labilithrix luteola]|uniref:Mce family protein n=1 Tax=Labilithrix luteola TaxID=1391654 RepID=A0A0K1Q2I5_9BACT|nr:Mce family protein [Labilithrix luteola]